MSSGADLDRHVADRPGGEQGLLLLTKADCHFCDLAAQVVERLAGEFELSTAEVRLESAQGMELAEATGVIFPPAIFLDGTLLAYGRPSYRRLRRDLSARGIRPRSGRDG